MRSALAVPPESLPEGVQRARISCSPSCSSSAGIEAIQAYELTGRKLDQWQKDELIGGCGEREDGRWAAFEVAVVAPRQNGKDEIFLARELAGLFVWDERLIGHSAHQFDTAMEHMERLVQLVDDVPEFRKRLAPRQPNRSHGNEGIKLRSGARIRFRARTRGGSFRGFTGDCLVFNEAMDLPDPVVGSILPILSARSMLVPGPQVWYGASPVDQQTMANGLVLARLRAAGIAGDNDRLAYFEHSAGVREWLEAHDLAFDPERPEIEQITEEMLGDPVFLAEANPALGQRISHEHVMTEFRSPSMTLRQMAVERGGVGDWPNVNDDADRVITVQEWRAIAEQNRENTIVDIPSFALDSDPDQTRGSIAAAGKRADGLTQFAIVANDRGTDWMLERCLELKTQHRRAEFAIDKRGPLAGKIPAMKAAKLRVKEISTEDYGRACSEFVTAVTGRRVRYPAPQPELENAIAAARKKPMGDAWKWSRRQSTTADISPLVAVTLATWSASQTKARARFIDLNDVGGGKMQGTRLPDAVFGVPGPGWDAFNGKTQSAAGSYIKVDYDGRLEWWIVDPNGRVGRLTTHTVEEHEDGTITVTPSILDKTPGGYHGWLERGVWRSA